MLKADVWCDVLQACSDAYVTLLELCKQMLHANFVVVSADRVALNILGPECGVPADDIEQTEHVLPVTLSVCSVHSFQSKAGIILPRALHFGQCSLQGQRNNGL